MAEMFDGYLTVSQTARVLGVSIARVAQLANRGQLSAIRDPVNRRLITRESVRTRLDERLRQVTTEEGG